MRWELDDLAGASDLAARYGVGKAAISNWVKRYGDFPAPLTHVGTRPVYSLRQVDRWYEQHFGDRPDKLRQRAEELERQAANLRSKAARYDTT